MDFSLRRLTRDEMDQAALIHRQAIEDRLPWLPKLHTPEEDRVFYRERVFTECEVWGAVDGDGQAIGFIAFRKEWVDQLHVLPEWQRQGVGAALLRIAQAAASPLNLWTFQRNLPARRFYEKHGFVVVEETDGSGNEEHEPDVRYRWALPEAPGFY